MVPLALGIALGFALGLLVIGFLAVGAYDRGFEDARGRRKELRAELSARRVVARRQRIAAVAAPSLPKAS